MKGEIKITWNTDTNGSINVQQNYQETNQIVILGLIEKAKIIIIKSRKMS